MMTRYDLTNKPSAELFERAFELIQRSFPVSEYRNKSTLLDMLDWPTYALYVEQAAERGVAGLICAHEFGGMRFIETFCVVPDMRGAGLGGRLLDEYAARADTPVVLEVEPPRGDIERRRIAFYRRHGFELDERYYIMPPLEADRPALRLYLMSTRPLGEDFEAVRDAIYRTVYRIEPEDVPRLEADK